jgi:hypothetical protein
MPHIESPKHLCDQRVDAIIVERTTYTKFCDSRFHFPVKVDMQKITPTFATGLTSRVGQAVYAPQAEDDLRAAVVTERLSAFVTDRERWTNPQGGAVEVIEFVEMFARHEGPESALEMLNLAARFKDYDIADYEVYRELVSTSSNTRAYRRAAMPRQGCDSVPRKLSIDQMARFEAA